MKSQSTTKEVIFANASHTIRNREKFAGGYFDLMVNWLRHTYAL